jgi:hypothetical protein
MVLDAFNDGSAHRYEVFDLWFCTCGHACKHPKRPGPKVDHIVSAAEEFPNLILLVGFYTQRYTIEKISSMAPRLRALRYPCVPAFRRVDECPQRTWIESLTHLELANVNAASTPVGKQVTLPRLSVLSLKLNRTLDGKLWLHRWSLPALKTLNIHGSFATEWVDGIDQFLARGWPSVTSLSLNLVYVESRLPPTMGYYTIRSTFWTSFPNLSTFGPCPEMLADNVPPPPPLYRPFSLVVSSLWNEFWLTSSQSLSRALQIINEWKITTVIFLCESEVVMDMLREENPQRRTQSAILRNIQRPSPFFAAAMDRNIPLLDIDRISFSQQHTVELLELIQNWEVDESRWRIHRGES